MVECSKKKNWSRPICKKQIGEGEFKLVLPLFDNSKNKIKKKEYQPYLRKMENIFGGSTSYRAGGCYIDEKKKIQCEGNVIISSVRDFENPYNDLSHLNHNERKEKLNEDYTKIKKLAREARKQFGQESVMAVFDNIKDASLTRPVKRKEKLPRKMLTKKYEPFREIF